MTINTLTDAEREDVLRAHVHISPRDLTAVVERIKADAYAAGLAARGGNTDNTLRDLLDSTYEGAVMSNARYGEGFHDGWRIAMEHVRAALDAAPAPTEDQPLHFGYLRECPDGMNCQRHGCLQAHVAAPTDNQSFTIPEKPLGVVFTTDGPVEQGASTDHPHGKADEHVCATKPLCDGWPYGPDDAFRTIAAVSNPGERKESRDGWAVTMRHRPALFEQEAKRATERLHAAIAHARAVVDGPTTEEEE